MHISFIFLLLLLLPNMTYSVIPKFEASRFSPPPPSLWDSSRSKGEVGTCGNDSFAVQSGTGYSLHRRRLDTDTCAI